jgi:site-specific DNA-methyltransferase (adenine-specific)/adenine-specific DNA-methyltransferase
MKKLKKQQRDRLISLLNEGRPIPDEYRFIIPFETERDYELIYEGKERKEDILVDTLSVPFQPIKKFGVKKEDEWHNKLIFADNLQVLKHLLKLKDQGELRNRDGKNGIKLIYIDPPFAIQKEFRGSKGEKAYQDKLAGAQFLEFLRKRLIFFKELLTDDGSIYVHLDEKRSHYIKVLLDEVFGENKFQREIVWRIGWLSGYKTTAKNWIRNHDVIFFYTNNPEKFTFNKLYIPYPEGYKRRDGSLPEGEGYPIEDTWNCNELDKLDSIQIMSFSGEKTGFPTQKNENLLARIISVSSEKDDIILDCFAGAGTTGAVAEKLGRRWIMIDSSKLSIYTMQKRMLNLRAEIGHRGKALEPKPFVLYNAGLYQDCGFIEKMAEADYRKFVLELFGAEQNEHKIKGVHMHGVLANRSVMVFSQKDYLTHEFIDDLHKTVGKGLKDELYIIAPQSVVRFNEDYIDKGKNRYNILKVPYSIIQKILEKDFVRAFQPYSKDDINQTIESVGFDFIYPPRVECRYYEGKEKTLFDNLVIQITKFEPVQISKKQVEFLDPKKEALSMVLIDENYDGKVFDMDHYFFGQDIVENEYKIVFPKEKAGKRIMIIYLDILGNEKVEIKNIMDFKKR